MESKLEHSCCQRCTRPTNNFWYCDECIKILAKKRGIGQPNKVKDLESKTILEEAQHILGGERESDYGDPVENFKRIANIASAILNKPISPEECCVVMMSVKHARETFNHKRDNQVDLAAYAEILNRIKESNNE